MTFILFEGDSLKHTINKRSVQKTFKLFVYLDSLGSFLLHGFSLGVVLRLLIAVASLTAGHGL